MWMADFPISPVRSTFKLHAMIVWDCRHQQWHGSIWTCQAFLAKWLGKMFWFGLVSPLLVTWDVLKQNNAFFAALLTEHIQVSRQISMVQNSSCFIHLCSKHICGKKSHHSFQLYRKLKIYSNRFIFP